MGKIQKILLGVVLVVGVAFGAVWLFGAKNAEAPAQGTLLHVLQEKFPYGLCIGLSDQLCFNSAGAETNTGSLKLGTNSDAKTISTSGTCNLWVGGNTTIAATTTVAFDCQAGSLSASALTGVPAWASGDRVFLTQSTTTNSTNEGIRILGGTGSTTAGYIAVKIQNLTGTTYTIASSSMNGIQYLYER